MPPVACIFLRKDRSLYNISVTVSRSSTFEDVGDLLNSFPGTCHCSIGTSGCSQHLLSQVERRRSARTKTEEEKSAAASLCFVPAKRRHPPPHPRQWPPDGPETTVPTIDSGSTVVTSGVTGGVGHLAHSRWRTFWGPSRKGEPQGPRSFGPKDIRSTK